MRGRWRVAVLAALLAALVGCARREPPRAAVAPLELVAIDGRAVRLSELRGRVVLLDFFATWCAPCQEETPAMVALQQRFEAAGLVVVGLSMDDDADAVRRFAEQHGVRYPLVMADPALAERFGGVLGLPVKILVDKHGRLAERLEGAGAMATLGDKVGALLAE